MAEIAQGLFGLAVLIALAWLLSEERRRFPWRSVAVALALQFGLALLLLKLPGARQLFLALNDAVLALQQATKAGTGFVFGYLGGGDLPFDEPYPGAAFVLAFQALPLILVMSALLALLWHWRVLPLVVRGFAWLLERSLRLGGAAGVAAAANIFVGMVEAPILIRPYVSRLTRAELFLLMTCGMATVAGTVMVLYASFLAEAVPGALGHILTASVISVPAAVLVARIMVPGEAPTAAQAPASQSGYAGSMDAVVQGTEQGLRLLLNVVAMLLVLVALVALTNAVLAWLPAWGDAPITLQRIFGWIFAPIVWLLGIPWAEAQTAGALMGTKTVLNELIAYLDLSRLSAESLSPRSRLIMLYALCGFANFGSLGIMIGGLGSLAPERRGEIVGLGLHSIASGTLATAMTGAVVGLLH